MTATVDHPLTGDYAELHELWLKPNGIVGWMPEGATVTVDRSAGTVTWPRWRHLDGNSDPWENDLMVISDSWVPGEGHDSDEDGPVIDEQTTPFVAPYTEKVAALAEKCGLNVVVR